MMEASTTCTLHADGGVCNRYAAAPIISASGTVQKKKTPFGAAAELALGSSPA